MIAEATIAFFLYFEFVALVKAYFEENAHISLNRFIYIGITALLRVIINCMAGISLITARTK